MNILFTRSQMRSSFFSIVPLRIGGVVTFKLKAELELTSEEQWLVKKYSFSNVELVTSDTYDDLQRAFRPALLMGLVAVIVFAWLLPTQPGGVMGGGLESILIKTIAVPVIGVLTILSMTVVYFFNMRKSISLANLLNGGRTFFCYSVVELDEQEQELLDLSKRLHATLEKARDWGGREINPIPIGDPFYLPEDENTHHRSSIERGLYRVGSNIKKQADRLNNFVESAPERLQTKMRDPSQQNTDRAPNNPASPQQPVTSPPQTPPNQTQPNPPPVPQQPTNNPQKPNPSGSNQTHPFSPRPPNDPNDVGGGEFG